MSDWSTRVVLPGVLAGLTATLQLGPIWWPGPGYLLAMAATLPVFVVAALDVRRAPWMLGAAGVLTALFSLEEMAILLTMTGPLGLALGAMIRRPVWQAVAAGAGALTLGMLLLPIVAGVYAWGGLERLWALPWRLGAYLCFALPYSFAWWVGCRKLYRHLAPALATRYTRVEILRKGVARSD